MNLQVNFKPQALDPHRMPKPKPQSHSLKPNLHCSALQAPTIPTGRLFTVSWWPFGHSELLLGCKELHMVSFSVPEHNIDSIKPQSPTSLYVTINLKP